MISLDEVEKTILELESKDTTFAVCERLAWLYIVRDHLMPASKFEPVASSGSSEFLSCVCDKNCADVWNILDSHMSELKTVYPNEYNILIKKIQEK